MAPTTPCLLQLQSVLRKKEKNTKPRILKTSLSAPSLRPLPKSISKMLMIYGIQRRSSCRGSVSSEGLLYLLIYVTSLAKIDDTSSL